MNPVPWLLVALGGAMGSVLRFWMGLFVLRMTPTAFPWPTLVVNFTGSFLIGLLAPALLLRLGSEPWRLFLIVGVLGGFTTFSAFSLETLSLLQGGRSGAALVYVLASVTGGLLLAALGMRLGTRW